MCADGLLQTELYQSCRADAHSNATKSPLGLKSFLNHSQTYLTIQLLRLR